MSRSLLFYFGLSVFCHTVLGEVWQSPGQNQRVYGYQRSQQNGDGMAGPLNYHSPCEPSPTSVVEAVAYVGGSSPNSGEVSGSIYFTEELQGSRLLMIEGEISGLSPGLHGLKIEEFGNLNGGCSSGFPFNPPIQFRGDVRFAGDLGNINAGSNGVANIKISDDQLSLNGVDSIVGRMVVVYEHQDDDNAHGPGPSAVVVDGTVTPNFKAACGVIGVLKEANNRDIATNASSVRNADNSGPVRPNPAAPAGGNPGGSSPFAWPVSGGITAPGNLVLVLLGLILPFLTIKNL